MKIHIRQLRKIIREALEEDGWLPGRWYPNTGEPVSDEELDVMGHAGLGLKDKDMDEGDEDTNQ